MLGGAWKLSAELEEAKLPNVRWQFKRSPEEEHGTIPYISTYAGLQAIFEGYRIADPIAFVEEGGLPAFERHYAQVSKRLGYTVAVPARAYGDTLSELSNRERFAEAEEVGKKMLEQDPKNTWALSALAQVDWEAERRCSGDRLSDASVATHSGQQPSTGPARELQSGCGQDCAKRTATRQGIGALRGRVPLQRSADKSHPSEWQSDCCQRVR